MDRTFRPLRPEEIQTLQNQTCSAENWNQIEVAGDFDPKNIHRVQFSGNIRLGRFTKMVTFPGGIQQPAGLSDVHLHNCQIADDVYIHNVAHYIANYNIEQDAVLRNIGLLMVDQPTTFGNGTQVRAINEQGGREIPIYDQLTAQIAYVIALYRHRTKVLDQLQQLIHTYVESLRCETGSIGAGARITDCAKIINVKIGPAAVIDSAGRLENGTINSCPQDPAHVGTGVMMKDFIMCCGARVDENCIIEKCFIGQGTQLARQYSSENSVFFANCAGYHGESCSVFAGPFTVTHHKSTLLIAGLYSFLNAGSGSNQSNHMYKLGPCHQGIIERGSKTTSDSYVLWPAKIGPFTMIMGRHYGNCDTSDLPYSYLIESKDESVCVPGVNLRSIGTVRDAKKWPKRDRRKCDDPLDLIIYNLITPYTVEKMNRGIHILQNLKSQFGENTQSYYYNSVKIKRSSLENGIRFYQLGIDRYVGNILVQRLRQIQLDSTDQIRRDLASHDPHGQNQWLDIAGLITPAECVEEILLQLENKKITSTQQLRQKFQQTYDQFENYEWAWVIHTLQNDLKKTVQELTPDDLIHLINRWIQAVETLDQMRCQDAAKEYAPGARIGYGLNGDTPTRDQDFARVRGTQQQDDFILAIKERLELKKQTAEKLIESLQRLK